MVAIMSTPHIKRRRLNEATKTLHKPFKSPFRTPLKQGFDSDPPSSDLIDVRIPSPGLTITSFTPSAIPIPDLPIVAKPPLSRPSRGTPARTVQKKTLSKPSVIREIMQMRNEIQILSQAHALATSNKDDDLTLLIDRWRTASRAAAEELFASTRDRVNRMGGVGAWKEREKEQNEWRRKADMEEMDAEREKFKAREKEDGYERCDEEYAEADVEGEDRAEKETFKCADDDVSVFITAKTGAGGN
jgi:Swi5-dependent recombination DNA repair protein 1